MEPYLLSIAGFEGLTPVRSLIGKEALSKSWRFDVVVRMSLADAHDVERAALALPVRLTFQLDGAVRTFHGVVAAVTLMGKREDDRCDASVRVVPRLWLLKKRRRSRVFQNQRVPDVVARVLGDAGIASRWQLRQPYPIREYVTQFEESDYQFVTRLLAESGIFFFFHQAGGEGPVDALASAVEAAAEKAGLAAAIGDLVSGDSLICADDAAFYPPLGDSSGAAGALLSAVVAAPLGAVAAPTLQFLTSESTTASRSDKVTQLDFATRVEPDAAVFREYDPERPLVRFADAASSRAPFEDAPGTGGRVPSLEVYDHHAPMLFPKWSQPSDEAARILRQERRRAAVAHGESGCSSLAPGFRFTLAGHPVARLDREWAVTAVTHRGRVHADGASPHVFECAFECVPATQPFLAPRPKRKSVQVCLTATVVGPEGSEIHVDERAQIKVQFHWDREGRDNDGSSCWIRTMHPWAGVGYGVQFIPRVGMEVVVVFEGGDPDKPIVLGTVGNASHPPPFTLPGDKTRSGIRTQSSPGGQGFNEISFEDALGAEQIFIHAQRDLDTTVERDHTLRVLANQHVVVAGRKVEDVTGGSSRVSRGDSSEETYGHRVETVAGDADERVSGARTTRVEGATAHFGRGDTRVECDSDVSLRALGSVVTVVGQEDKPRSWVTHAAGVASLTGLKRLELASDGELVLRVGKSSLRITPELIEIDAPAVVAKGKGAGISAKDDGLAFSSKGDSQWVVGKKLVVKTDGASLAMEKEVKLDGSQILLNSPEKAKDPPPPEAEPPTTIELTDESGKPLAEQRFVITLDDASEVTGRTDKDGKAELELPSGGDIVFPELTMPGDSPKGAPQPYVIRQGDFLSKLAFRYAFDADEVWSDGKNSELKAKRKDPNQLLPGDVIHFAHAKKKPYPLKKGETNSYSAEVPKTKVVLNLNDATTTFSGEPYKIEGLPRETEGTVDASGQVVIEAPIHVREVRLVLTKRRMVFPIKLGDLDPIDAASGVRTRLAHLGYLPSSAEAMSEAEADQRLKAAVRDFQHAQGLEPTGEVDEATRSALTKAHGS